MFAGNCHCRDCQRSTGGAYAPAIGVPAPSLKIHGAVKYYESPGENGNLVSRGFCPTCGARLFGKPAATPIVAIYVGSLDDPSVFKPAADVYTASAQPWDYMNPQVPTFPKMPQS